MHTVNARYLFFPASAHLFLEQEIKEHAILSSDASGATLRMMQVYEQKQNDLSRAQVILAISLAKALGCEIEDLID